MKFLKTMSIKTRYLIFNIFMTLAGIFAALKIVVDVLSDSAGKLMNWSLVIAFFFFIVGFAFRLTLVKCPFCGDKLKDLQKAPDVCPACKKSAYAAYDPAAVEAPEAIDPPEETEETEEPKEAEEADNG